MTVDTSLPPALFDLEPEMGVISTASTPIERRPGHAIRVHQAWPSGQFIACICAEQSPPRIARDPDALTRWAYKHLGIEYDTEVTRTLQKLAPVCDVTWTEADPALPHDEHRCIFGISGPHTRHECRCGLNRHEEATA